MRSPVKPLALAAILTLLNGCAPDGAAVEAAPPLAAGSGPASDYPVVVGDPFTIDGTTYKPEDKLSYDAVGYASVWLDGAGGISAAHKTLPLPSYVEVTSLESGRTILVRVERRGPMVNDRLIELSPGAAMQLGLTGDTKTPVRVRRVNPPEPERAALRSGQSAPLRMDTPKSLVAVLLRKLDGPTTTTPTPPALPTTPSAQVAAAARPSPSASPAAAAKPSVPTVVAKPAAPSKPPRPAPVATPMPAASAPAQAVAPTAPKPAPKPRPVVPSAAPAGSSRGALVVQVAAFASRQNADRAAASLGGSIEPAGRFFRVRLGRFATQAEAAAALAKARAAGYSDARIQRAN